MVLPAQAFELHVEDSALGDLRDRLDRVRFPDEAPVTPWSYGTSVDFMCAGCHSGNEFTDANARLHPATDVVSEPEPDGAPSYASRSATKQYRTAPLRGLWQHPPYFHNGSAATLDDVVRIYNSRKSLGLTASQMADLVQYLKSL